MLAMKQHKLKTNLVVNDTVIPLNQFTSDYIGNVLKAISSSLGYDAKKVCLYITPDGLQLYADERLVPIRKEFVRLIVESTVKGALSPLKGIFWLERISICTE